MNDTCVTVFPRYYLADKQYGFLQSEDLIPLIGKPDIFVHGSAIGLQMPLLTSAFIWPPQFWTFSKLWLDMTTQQCGLDSIRFVLQGMSAGCWNRDTATPLPLLQMPVGSRWRQIYCELIQV
eukprot:6481021-Amphidinium_carterae.1